MEEDALGFTEEQAVQYVYDHDNDTNDDDGKIKYYNYFFIKRDEQFYPLSPLWEIDIAGNYWDIGLQAGMFVPSDWHPGSIIVPELRSGDSLVLFSQQEPMSTYYISKAKDVGYTVPIYIYKIGDDYFVDTIYEDGEIPKSFYSYIKTSDNENDNSEEIDLEGDVENINDMSVKDFYNVSSNLDILTFDEAYQCIDDYQKDDAYDPDESRDTEIGIIRCNLNDEVSIGFREGSMYKEMVITPCTKAYFITSQSIPINTETGKSSYVTLDTSQLESGFYCIEDSVFEVK